MSTPILITKLYIPSPRSNLVPRPRLIKRLNATMRGKLTLLSAPAGFGKTTLVSHWLSQNNCAAAWFSLDETDNDPTTFVTYFVAALQQIDPSLGQKVQSVLRSPQPPPLDFLMANLINDIATANDVAVVNIEFVFVLDDYHIIENNAIHDALTFLLDRLPPQMHLVITSRADPPLPLSRLRVRGQMVEIRADDLRFNAEEATALLNEMIGLRLSAENVIALENRTEGWIAGLQLAALSLQGQHTAGADSFISAFTGDDRYIVDYLVEEVLYQQSQEIQTFLIQTSILDHMSGSLCDAVTGRADSQAILETLEQRNLFIVPLDNKRLWYRYHHLFADLLRYRLYQTQPEQVPEFHRRASRWCEQQGGIDHAISHALAAEDFERTADLVESHAKSILWDRGNMIMALGWLKRIPESVIYARPRLSITYAWVLFELFIDQLETIESLLQNAETKLHIMLAEGDKSKTSIAQMQIMLGEVWLTQASVARRRGDASLAIDLCHQARENVPEDAIFVRGSIILALAAAYDSLGNMVKATPNYAKGIDFSRKTENIYVTLISVAKLIDVHRVQGQLHRAKRLFEQWQPHLKQRYGPDAGMLYVNGGELFYELNDLDTATMYLQKGVEMCRPFDAMALMVVKGCIILARIKQAQGDPASALELFEEAERFSEIDKMLYPTVRMQAARAGLWLTQGNLTSAAKWVTENSLGIDDDLTYAYEIDYLTLVRVLIVQNKTRDALYLLERLSQSAESGERWGRVIEIRMLQALALQSEGDTTRALAALKEALSLAEPEGYIRLFVDEGEPMATLLQQTTSQNVDSIYVDKLLAAFPDFGLNLAGKSKNQNIPSNDVTGRKPKLVEPLTRRELKTLRLLATELSIPEIADEMVVAVSTIRSHTKSIYSKLGVHSRYEAVHSAEELGLL